MKALELSFANLHNLHWQLQWFALVIMQPRHIDDARKSFQVAYVESDIVIVYDLILHLSFFLSNLAAHNNYPLPNTSWCYCRGNIYGNLCWSKNVHLRSRWKEKVGKCYSYPEIPCRTHRTFSSCPSPWQDWPWRRGCLQLWKLITWTGGIPSMLPCASN